MAASDPDHPALDEAFWQRAAEQMSSERSPEFIEIGDLERLSDLAREWLQSLARRLPDQPSGASTERLKVIALAQGAALHFLDRRHGVKDFDLWAFFEEVEGEPRFPHRMVWHVDFGPSRFGANPTDESRGYRGRRIDVMGRTIPFGPENDEAGAIRSWLLSGAASARHLAQRPLIAIFPHSRLGQIIWPA
ncbi:hypothetical protein [uncultured Enterovirga sp.]|uniref:hypothetical protein n=1 Tax=uncultured Enterovirga sp. TaxID=2026352 RepID=UPI0035CB7B74